MAAIIYVGISSACCCTRAAVGIRAIEFPRWISRALKEKREWRARASSTHKQGSFATEFSRNYGIDSYLTKKRREPARERARAILFADQFELWRYDPYRECNITADRAFTFVRMQQSARERERETPSRKKSNYRRGVESLINTYFAYILIMYFRDEKDRLKAINLFRTDYKMDIIMRRV